MHFDFNAYEKVYPTEPEIQKPVETMAEGFEPTKDEMAKDGKPGEPEKVVETPEPEQPKQVETAGEPEGENNG